MGACISAFWTIFAWWSSTAKKNTKCTKHFGYKTRWKHKWWKEPKRLHIHYKAQSAMQHPKRNKQRGPHGWYDHSSPCGVDLAPLVLIDCLSVLSMVSPPGSLVPWWLGLGWQPVPGHGITKQFEDYNLVSTCLVLTDTQSECIQDTTASSHCQKIWWTRLLSCYVVSCRAQHVFWLSARGSRMQQVFWNLPTRTKTHVWEILGNPVNPAGVNLDVPFFPTCATPGDLSATISPQFFIEF